MRNQARYRATCLAILVALFAVGSPLVDAQTAGKTVRDHLVEGTEAYKKKDYATFLDHMRQASAMRPGAPPYLYNVACGLALTGRPVEALAILSRLAGMGLVMDIAGDDDLASLRESAEFKAIAERFEANKAPVSHSATAFTIGERGLITEGVAYDPTTETFYVTSVRKRKILAVDRKGTARVFASPESGLWGALGASVDPKARVLWVASAAVPQMENFKDEDKNRSGLFKFDLATGRLIKKYVIPDTAANHALGDVIVGPGGDVYTTDSSSAAIYRVSPKRDELEVVLAGAPMISPQGLSFSPDGKVLFVADYALGIFAVDPVTGKATLLQLPDSVAATGTDGIYFHRGGLVMIQNGITPHRVVRATLGPKLDRIEKVDVVEANNPQFDEPTLGVLVGDTLFFVANSQWGSVDRAGVLAPVGKLKDPLILKAKL